MTQIAAPQRVKDPQQEQINRSLYQGILTLIGQVNALPAISGVVSADSIWDAIGDLAVGSGANTAGILTVGADGTVLTADSSVSLGVKWATPAGQNLTFGQVMGMISLGV
jgi:hypothetical protein